MWGRSTRRRRGIYRRREGAARVQNGEAARRGVRTAHGVAAKKSEEVGDDTVALSSGAHLSVTERKKRKKGTRMEMGRGMVLIR